MDYILCENMEITQNIANNEISIMIIGRDCLTVVFSNLEIEFWFNVLVTCKLFNEVGRLAFDPSFNKNRALYRSCENNYTKSVEYLIRDPRVDIAILFNHPIQWACGHGHLEIVKFLLNDDRCDPSDNENQALLNAVQEGHIEIVKLLLNHKKIDPDNTSVNLIDSSILNRHTEITKILLNDGRVELNQMALIETIKNRDIELTELLLKDTKIDPSLNENEAIQCAVAYDNIQAVRLLLNDQRIDPCDCDNKALNIAIEYGAVDIIEMLLKHPKIAHASNIKGSWSNTLNVYKTMKLAIEKNKLEVFDFLIRYSQVGVYSTYKYVVKEVDQKLRPQLVARLKLVCSMFDESIAEYSLDNIEPVEYTPMRTLIGIFDLYKLREIVTSFDDEIDDETFGPPITSKKDEKSNSLTDIIKNERKKAIKPLAKSQKAAKKQKRNQPAKNVSRTKGKFH